MTLPEVLIYLAGILWGIELIPQIMKIYNSKNVESLSLPFFVICLLAYIIYGIGNIMLENWVIVISHIPSFIFLSITIALIMKYRR